MWAKFKPVRKAFDLSARPADWWKADDGWCGLNIANALVSESTDVAGIQNKFTNDGKNGWTYNRPRGGASEPFRQLDFDGYHHLATPFVSGYNMPYKWAKDALGNFDVSFRVTIAGADDAEFLSFKDLPLENYYLGIAFIGEQNNKVYRLTNPNVIGDGLIINMNVKDMEAGKYLAYPFMSSKSMTMLDVGFDAAKVYTLPNCGAIEFEVLLQSVHIQIQGWWTSDTPDANGYYRLEYTVTITNYNQYDVKLSNNIIKLRYGNKGFDDAQLPDEKELPLQLGEDIYIEHESSVSLFGIFTNVSEGIYNNPKIWVSLNSSQYKQDAVPMQSTTPKAIED